MIVLPIVAVVGCERRFDVEPTYATKDSYSDQIDVDRLPTETRELYERMLNGSLAGTNAGDYQPLLNTAQEIRDRESNRIYIFQMTDFDRPFDEVHEEFVPFMYVCVQKTYGHIYKCDLADPEW
jgi:hypothetical protein